MNVKQWLAEKASERQKKSMPILSFPGVELIETTVGALVKDAALQAKLLKAVADRTPSLAAVSPMDLSVEAECFGAPVLFEEGEIPTVTGAVVASIEEAENLRVPSVGECRTGVCIEGMKLAKQQITDRPVFAGVIGSYSLAGRLLDVTEALVYCYTDPDLLHVVLEKATDFLVEYIRAFKNAGLDGVVIAEPLAGLLSLELAEEFSEPYIRRIVEEVQSDDFIVIYHNCGDTALQIMPSILNTGAAAYHFGNAVKMIDVLKAVPSNCIVMGNIDPAGEFKNGTPESIRAATLALLEECASYPNFLISSGCDIPPQAKWENIDAYYAAIAEFYAEK
ncbi:MAG: uroporphyrinogen decarboxylase family protein [Clostridia bacterium]|nr:uroporphyrinogen decarboxylase family protein [Clostridia bacterium]